MQLYCSKCRLKNKTIHVIQCGHSFCLQCLNFLYINNKRSCLYNCLEKIKGLQDILPLLKHEEMFDNTMTYSDRICYLNQYFTEHRKQLKNTFIKDDKRYKNYPTTVHIKLSDFIKVKNNAYLVYEIYRHQIIRDVDYFEYDAFVVQYFLIYYQESKICFVYERINDYIDVNRNGYTLRNILRDVDKETIDKTYLNLKKSPLHKKLWPELSSEILNPDGYVQFPEGFEKLHCLYVNRTKQYDEKRKLHCFHNYRWIHFTDMVNIEQKFEFFLTLHRQKNICSDLKREILSFL